MATTCEIPSTGGGWSGSLPRLVALSLLVLAAAGCRTYPPLEPVRLAALEAELGQLLLVGFEGTEAEGNDAIERLLCETRVGGVVLFVRNITGDAQAARLTRALAERARACTGRPLLIAVDAEGGQVMRLGPGAGFTATLSAGELGESNDFTLTELEARRIGRMLRSAGINWNLAPVVDVGYEPRNPVIVGAARSFSANPLLVTEHARAFIHGLHAEGVLTALKHFPGHGSTLGDSHKGFVEIPATANREAELAPYRALIAERLVDAVMTAHVVDRALDSEFPATLSRATLTGLLRGELGFDGPVVTDDLRMGAIERRWGLETAAVTALAAGADLLLIADDRLPDGGSAARAALATIQKRLVSGRLDPERVEAALVRVRALKARLGDG
ncbi:MAG: glycoside hydrolase family 3 [Candidatus Rokuibacteriota bacterium]|nr:MAG: glycoside hydrolase family 3 [Candidatus Rokubacteria bacterium]PYN69060.1 MAG: glycoside hydrolase family 3 [Candidatus Rokubacteria bacterium]